MNLVSYVLCSMVISLSLSLLYIATFAARAKEASMGIAGFFIWLQRWYSECLKNLDYDGSKLEAEMMKRWKGIGYDNFYVDMNGMIHPCCHDTAPRPEPESETEMIERIFDQLEKLVRVVQPRKCLVLAIDGVAPRSKLNQQRTRRFRAAHDRLRGEELYKQEAEKMMEEHPSLPTPKWREKWDHNQITPSTAFMERVGQAIEWFILFKINTDPLWSEITVVFSDAHVPGEGEHKIMHYIRTLREQPGYDPNTSHCIVGMDADLICLGLATHETNFCILRNCLTENFQQDPDKYCVFNITAFRNRLKKDFGSLGSNMQFERVVDDFVFLCFFVGNDFLPHMPLINIKAKGIETLLDHYVREFEQHGYLTKKGEIRFNRVAEFLKNFVDQRHNELVELRRRTEANGMKVHERKSERMQKIRNELNSVLASLKPDKSNAQEVADAVVKLRVALIKEEEIVVSGKYPLPFSYGEDGYRDKYYQAMFGWDCNLDTIEGRNEFESYVEALCLEYHRGMQWVLRYYTVGCPSWEWYYPFYYAPLLEDVAKYSEGVNVEMQRGNPLRPLEQLLAVLPRESVQVLPEELHKAVLDRGSVLNRFYPETFDVDHRDATFQYQGVAHLPFINCKKLCKAARQVTEIEEDYGATLLFTRASSPVGAELLRLISSIGKRPAVEIPQRFTAKFLPIAGRIKPFPHTWPIGARITCPDGGLVKRASAANYAKPVLHNDVLCIIYEWNLISEYQQEILDGANDRYVQPLPQLNGDRVRFVHGTGHGKPGGGATFTRKPRPDNGEGADDQAPRSRPASRPVSRANSEDRDEPTSRGASRATSRAVSRAANSRAVSHAATSRATSHAAGRKRTRDEAEGEAPLTPVPKPGDGDDAPPAVPPFSIPLPRSAAAADDDDDKFLQAEFVEAEETVDEEIIAARHELEEAEKKNSPRPKVPGGKGRRGKKADEKENVEAAPKSSKPPAAKHDKESDAAPAKKKARR